MEDSNFKAIDSLDIADKLRLFHGTKSHYKITKRLFLTDSDSLSGYSASHQSSYSECSKAVRKEAERSILDELEKLYRHLAAVGVSKRTMQDAGYTDYTFKKMMRVAGFSL